MLDIKIHRGDIFWIRQDYSAVGSEQKRIVRRSLSATTKIIHIPKL